MLEKGIVEIVQDSVSAFYSRLFLLEKSSDRWGPIKDLLPLKKTFKCSDGDCGSGSGFHRERS